MLPQRPSGFRIFSLSLVFRSDGHRSYFVITRVPFRSHGIRSIISRPNTQRSICTTSGSSSMAMSLTFNTVRLPSRLLIYSPNPSLRESSFIYELCWGCGMLHLLGGLLPLTQSPDSLYFGGGGYFWRDIIVHGYLIRLDLSGPISTST